MSAQTNQYREQLAIAMISGLYGTTKWEQKVDDDDKDAAEAVAAQVLRDLLDASNHLESQSAFIRNFAHERGIDLGGDA